MEVTSYSSRSFSRANIRPSRSFRYFSNATLWDTILSSVRYSRSSLALSAGIPSRSPSAVRSNRCSETLSSLDGSTSRISTSTVAIIDQGTSSFPLSMALSRNSPKPSLFITWRPSQ